MNTYSVKFRDFSRIVRASDTASAGAIGLSEMGFEPSTVGQDSLRVTEVKLPKTTRGLQYPGHVRINRTQLRKWLEQTGTFHGFIVGNNVNSFHFFGGWCLACALDMDDTSLEVMESKLNEFSFYLDPELGNAPAVFLRKPTAATVPA